MKQLKLGFFTSHGGSNMQAIIDACKTKKLNMKAAIVISNNSKSKAIKRAKAEDIPCYHLNSKTHPNSDELDAIITKKLIEHEVDLVILAGYMRKIGPKTLNKFKGKILNIHPALLPKYGGKGFYGIYVHESVINNNETETGVTIHLVDGKYDHGKTINQIRVKVLKNETPESLQKRVLTHEHKFFVDTLRKISAGEIEI